MQKIKHIVLDFCNLAKKWHTTNFKEAIELTVSTALSVVIAATVSAVSSASDLRAVSSASALEAVSSASGSENNTETGQVETPTPTPHRGSGR